MTRPAERLELVAGADAYSDALAIRGWLLREGSGVPVAVRQAAEDGLQAGQIAVITHYRTRWLRRPRAEARIWSRQSSEPS